MRGIIGGKTDIVSSAATEANSAVAPTFDVRPGGSNTLQSRDSEATEARRAAVPKATVSALAQGSDPRLYQSRSCS
jgi:hypothetical protein